jgi:hypothetical protein
VTGFGRRVLRVSGCGCDGGDAVRCEMDPRKRREVEGGCRSVVGRMFAWFGEAHEEKLRLMSLEICLWEVDLRGLMHRRHCLLRSILIWMNRNFCIVRQYASARREIDLSCHL